jgi:hypothetical protein
MAKKTIYKLQLEPHIQKDVHIPSEIRKLIRKLDVYTAEDNCEAASSTCLDLMELFLSVEDYGKTIV